MFGQTTQDHSQDEIVFAITPHVIRGTDVNEINQRADRYRHRDDDRVAPREPAAGRAGAGAATGRVIDAASATQDPASQPPANQAPANQPPASAPTSAAGRSESAAARPASFLFDPPTIQAAKGNTFVVNLLMSGAQNVYSVPVQLNYDPKMLQLVNVSNGGFLSQDGQAVALVHREDETVGRVADYRYTAAWGGRSFRAGRGSDHHLPGKGGRTNSADHHPRRSARSRPAGDHGQRSASLGDDAVEVN